MSDVVEPSEPTKTELQYMNGPQMTEVKDQKDPAPQENGFESDNMNDVTFGDHGSLIETLIDDSREGEEVNHNYKEASEHKVYPKEKYVTEDAIETGDVSPTKQNSQKNRVKFSEDDTSEGEATSLTDEAEQLEPLGEIHRAPSTESRDNPFQPDGDISNAANLIIRHSKISASEVVIVDPSSPNYKNKEPSFDTNENQEQTLSPIAASPVNCAPGSPENGGSTIKENGTVEETVSPEQVQVSESSPKQDGPETPTTAPAEGGDGGAPANAEPAKKKKECCTIL